MPKNFLIVPIHLDALFLEQDTLVREAFTDFSRLPFNDGTEDVNPDTAYLSESILSPPFENLNLPLAKGLHLHWALPDALTRGLDGGTREEAYEAIPNRWLIQRVKGGIVKKSWVVESDYLEMDLKNPHQAIAFPLLNSPEKGQPFGFLGRQLDGAKWSETSANRLKKLTVMGYGEPAFAAFYPNCHSVLGCYDEEINERSNLVGLSYRLMGWYSDLAQDPIARLAKNPGPDPPGLLENIKDTFAWSADENETVVPSGMLCFATLDFSPTTGDLENPNRNAPVSVSIGNSGLEALSAWLAHHSGGDVQREVQLEEQLESVFLQSKLQTQKLDFAHRFEEMRLEREFNGVKGGGLWELKAKGEASDTIESLSLPPGMEKALHDLNEAQRNHDHCTVALNSAQKVLFADWYKYITCAYPPGHHTNNYPNIDQVKWLIEQSSLAKVNSAKKNQDDARQLLTLKTDALSAPLSRFNEGKLPSEPEERKLIKEGVFLADWGMTSPIWVDNKPFSAQCLALDGQGQRLAIPVTNPIKAISLWLNIAAHSAEEALLLATDSAILLAKKGEPEGIQQIAVDGKSMNLNDPWVWRLLPKDRWFHLYILLDTEIPSGGKLYLFGKAPNTFLKGKLASVRLHKVELRPDDLFNDRNNLGQVHYELKEVAAPRFWQPKEPVLLLEGKAVEPMLRFGKDGRLREDDTLECGVGKFEDTFTASNFDQSFTTILSKYPNQAPGVTIGYDTWRTQPWHPFLLEWEASISPMQDGGNQKPAGAAFAPDFLTSNYALGPGSAVIKPSNIHRSSASFYSGRTILTPYAKESLQLEIIRQLNGLRQDHCYHVLDAKNFDRGKYESSIKFWYKEKREIKNWYSKQEDFQDALAAYKTWYEAMPVYNAGDHMFSYLSQENQQDDFYNALIKALETLQNHHFLSQALSGFHNGLLMQEQTLQLPVADPIGFQEYRDFAENVNKALLGHSNLAPLPHLAFLPIRSGTLKLEKLWVIDTFGRHREIGTANPTLANSLKHGSKTTSPQGGSADEAWLPPRFVQPARILCRWLSADAVPDQELNSHPESNPICGWLLSNHLDNSLAFYDAAGHGLGIIDQNAKWEPFPGQTPITVGQVPNVHLQRVIEWLIKPQMESGQVAFEKLPPERLKGFMTQTDKALETIAPENGTQQSELALLMGRPLAIVRVALKLELQGTPAIHHGWDALHHDMDDAERLTDGFEKVKVPLRLGDPHRFNDGLVGYWQEQHASGITLAEDFRSGDETTKPLIKVASDDTPLFLTLVIDPRADVHITTGILPVKALHIPKPCYTRAQQRIHITFLTAPVLFGKGQTALPLPREAGYRWSWLQQESNQSWTEIAQEGMVRKDAFSGLFKNHPKLWDELLRVGWLEALDTTRAKIIPSDQRKHPSLGKDFLSITDQVQAYLDSGHIIPVHTQAMFAPGQMIQEGWLKLSPSRS